MEALNELTDGDITPKDIAMTLAITLAQAVGVSVLCAVILTVLGVGQIAGYLVCGIMIGYFIHPLIVGMSWAWNRVQLYRLSKAKGLPMYQTHHLEQPDELQPPLEDEELPHANHAKG